MITLTVCNSYSHLTGLTPTQYKAIKQKLSYAVSASARYYGNYPNARRYLIDKAGSFPTGLLYIVQEYLDSNKLAYKEIEMRIRPSVASRRFNLREDWL